MPHGKSGIPQRKALAMGKGITKGKPAPRPKPMKSGKSKGSKAPMGSSHRY